MMIGIIKFIILFYMYIFKNISTKVCPWAQDSFVLYSLSAFSEKNSATLLFFPSFRYNLYKISIDYTA